LLEDPDQKSLVGKMAMGPSTAKEAGVIWAHISSLPKQNSLKETLESYYKMAKNADHHVNSIVRGLTIPLDTQNNVLIQSVIRGNPIVLNRNEWPDSSGKELLDRLGADVAAIIPLRVEDKGIGCIVVDNIFSRHPIMDRDMDILHLFANQAALAIENARLQSSLSQQLANLVEAYRKLGENQRQMIESEKMVAVGKLTAIAAHEFRTPLVSIGGFCRLTLKNSPPDSIIARNMRTVIAEVERLERVVKMLLEYVSNPDPKKQLADMNRLIKDVALFMRPKFEQGNIQLHLDLSSNLREIPFDIWQMRQVFLNLFANAVEAIPEGKSLSVATSGGEGGIQIVVADTGVGIPADRMDKIFQPFYSTTAKGTGLGLYICRQILEKHKGTIEVTSIPGEGTTIYLFIPER
jgi:signal transduction histidine kinase